MGKVYLVGAGPGDPELLTVKAMRILAKAEVVLHDALVSQEILDLISAEAVLIDVGKRCGKKLLTQDEINCYLVQAAREAKLVVRLKGGDPLVFGRAGEEIEALEKAGVDFEIVPGITSALAAAAAARVSLTDRRFASQVLLTTAHRKNRKFDLAWAASITAETSVVVYMPGDAYREIADVLIKKGFNPQTPCVIVSAAGRKTQQVQWKNLAGLWLASRVPAPALLIIGRIRRAEVDAVAGDIWKQFEVKQATDVQPLA